MGFNSWNCFGLECTQDRIASVAQAMAAKGLADLGWGYVNIDDGWQGESRNAEGAVQPDPDAFPDMAGLVEDIHGLGLKAGIYSTPWTRSFGGRPGCSSGVPRAQIRDESRGWFVGEQTFEEAHARQWAAWGFDYLKYDWNPMDLASGRRMARALRRSGRDIFFNPVNSMRDEDPHAWAEIADAFFLWRERERGDRDIEDTWESISGIGFRMSPWRRVARPGHWNDPDMLALGPVGWGQPRPNRLSPDEQRTHMSLWVLLAAPLLIGGDIARLSESELALLTNPDVLDIHQDLKGETGARIALEEGRQIWAKGLADGSLAVGLFNLEDSPRSMAFRPAAFGLPSLTFAHNLWTGEALTRVGSSLEAEVPAHGVAFFRVEAERPIDSSFIDALQPPPAAGSLHARY